MEKMRSPEYRVLFVFNRGPLEPKNNFITLLNS